MSILNHELSDSEWSYDIVPVSAKIPAGSPISLYSTPTDFNGDPLKDACGIEDIYSTISISKADAIAFAKHFGLSAKEIAA